VAPSATGAWLDYDRYSSGERNNSACTSSTTGEAWLNSAATGASAAVAQPTGFYLSQPCNVARPLACCITPKEAVFVGYTTATWNGNLGGFIGANAKCAAQYPSSWLCTVRNFNLADPGVVPGAQGAWLDYDRYSSGERNNSACTSGTTGEAWSNAASSGASAAVAGATGFYTSLPCNIARPLACCR
jgi:hypothetical protein